MLSAMLSTRTWWLTHPLEAAPPRRCCSIPPVRSLTLLEHGGDSWLCCVLTDTWDTGVVWISRENLHRIWRGCSQCVYEKRPWARRASPGGDPPEARSNHPAASGGSMSSSTY